MKTSAWHNAEVPLQRSYGQQHSAFVPCPPGKSGQPLYIQPNQFMYKNAYNMYSHSQPLQPRIPQPIQVMGQHSRNFLPAFANNEKSKNNTGQVNMLIAYNYAHFT